MIISSKKYGFIILLITAVLSIALLYFFVYPIYGKYFPKCLLYTFTGLYCPGCGSQRAIAALLHRDVLTALHDNLLAVLALPFLIYSLALSFTNIIRNKNLKTKIFYSTSFVKTVLILVVIFSILRNLPVYPFTLLAPL
jgi:hypothetical protein